MDWIANLKPGDQVVVDGDYGDLKVCKVDRVTPTGRIVIGASTFNQDGWLRGGYQYSSIRIREATTELLDRIHQQKVIREAQELMRRANPTYEQAEQIIKLLSA